MLIVPGMSIWKVAERKPGAGKHRRTVGQNRNVRSNYLVCVCGC